MTAWDSNFLLRHLLEDEPSQLVFVRESLQTAERRDEPIFLSQIVLVETAWVLRGLLTKRDVLETLDEVYHDSRFHCESPAEVAAALRAAAEHGDFSDHLIAAAALRAQAAPVKTFDRALSHSKHFEIFG